MDFGVSNFDGLEAVMFAEYPCIGVRKEYKADLLDGDIGFEEGRNRPRHHERSLVFWIIERSRRNGWKRYRGKKAINRVGKGVCIAIMQQLGVASVVHAINGAD